MRVLPKLAPFTLLAAGLVLLAADADAQRGRGGPSGGSVSRSAPVRSAGVQRSAPSRSSGFQRSAPSRPSYSPPSRPSTPSYSRPSTSSRPSYSRPSSGSTPSYTRPSTPSYTRPSTPSYTRPSTPSYTAPGPSARDAAPTYTRPPLRTAPPTSSTADPGATRAGPASDRGTFDRRGSIDYAPGSSSTQRTRFPRPATPSTAPDRGASGRGSLTDRLRPPSGRGPADIRREGRSASARDLRSDALDRYRAPDRAGRSDPDGRGEDGRGSLADRGRGTIDRAEGPGAGRSIGHDEALDRDASGRWAPGRGSSPDGPSGRGDLAGDRSRGDTGPGAARVGGSVDRATPGRGDAVGRGTRSDAADRGRGRREPRTAADRARERGDAKRDREVLVAGEVVAGATFNALSLGVGVAVGSGGAGCFFNPHYPYYGGGYYYPRNPYYGYFGFSAGFWYGGFYGCYPWYGWYSPWWICRYWWDYPWYAYRPYYYPTYYAAAPYYTTVVNYYYDDYVADPAPAGEQVEVAEGEGVAAVAPLDLVLPDAGADETSDPRGNSASWYLQKGDEAFREGRYGDATNYYTKACAFAPGDGLMFLVLSDALLATGDYHYGAYALRRAIELDPQLLDTPVDKHDFYGDPSEFDRHLATLESYLADRPTDDDARLLLAVNYLNGNRPAAAVDLLDEPLSRNLMRQEPAQRVRAAAAAVQYGR